MPGKDDIATEKMIQEKGLNAPRLTPDAIKSKIVKEDFHVFPGTTLTVCRLELENGFSVTGESAAVSMDNFDREIGEKIARENAINKIWPLEGYLLKEYLYQSEKKGEFMLQAIGSIGWAVQRMKEGAKVARRGWNGKGMFIYYVPAAKYPASGNTLGTMKGRYEDDLVPYREYVAMKTADDTIVPWVCSQSDLLAEDWEEVE